MALTSDNTAVVLTAAADLPDAAERHENWSNAPISVSFGDDVFSAGVDLSAKRFYELLATRRDHPRTAAASPGELMSLFEALPARYERVLVLSPPPQLSGTFDSAHLAARGDARVRVYDTGSMSSATVILAEAIQRLLERGTEDAELTALVTRFRDTHRYLIALDTLDYVVRGGRVSRAAQIAGQLANVKPVLQIVDAAVIPLHRVRGRKRSLDALVGTLEQETVDSPALRLGIAHANTPADAADVEARVRALRPGAGWDHRGELGPAMGTHAGPGAIVLAWFLDEHLVAD